jgi:antitoxin ParD1/3/4
MKIETMNISLPSLLKASVQQLVERGGYGNASEYMRELIRDDLKRRAKERLDDLLL